MQKNASSFQTFRILYFRYKDTSWYSLSIVVFLLLISVILIGRVIFPQIQNWLSFQKEVAEAKSRIAVLRNNEQQLLGTNESILNTQLQTVTAALPVEKDFAGVIRAISAAGANSGVAFNDYSFIVGNLSTESAELVPETYLDISISIQGDIENVNEFMTEIYQKVPLVEILSINFSSNTASMKLRFYYKVIPEKVPVNYDKPIGQIEGDKARLMQMLKAWKDSLGSDIIGDVPVGTESASPF